jgi:uncharacterized RDD family membrane protein YckC
MGEEYARGLCPLPFPRNSPFSPHLTGAQTLTDGAAPSPAFPPRLFWLRALALLLDLALVSVIAVLLAAAVQPFVAVKLEARTLINYKSCEDVTEKVRGSQTAAALNVQPGETFSAAVCGKSSFGLTQQRRLTFTATKQDGNIQQNRSLYYPVNDNLEQIEVFDTEPLELMLAPLALALWAGWRGRTPGKAMVGLALVADRPDGKTLRSMLGREYLRLLPFAVLGLAGFIDCFSGAGSLSPEEFAKAATDGSPLWLASALKSAAAFLFFVPHLASLIRWRGRMFYDRIFGFDVRRR